MALRAACFSLRTFSRKFALPRFLSDFIGLLLVNNRLKSKWRFAPLAFLCGYYIIKFSSVHLVCVYCTDDNGICADAGLADNDIFNLCALCFGQFHRIDYDIHAVAVNADNGIRKSLSL